MVRTVYIVERGAAKNTIRFMLTIIPIMSVFSSCVNERKDKAVNTIIQNNMIDKVTISCEVVDLIFTFSTTSISCSDPSSRLESSMLSSLDRMDEAASYVSRYFNLTAPKFSHRERITPGALADRTNMSDVRKEYATHPMQFPVYIGVKILGMGCIGF